MSATDCIDILFLSRCLLFLSSSSSLAIASARDGDKVTESVALERGESASSPVSLPLSELKRLSMLSFRDRFLSTRNVTLDSASLASRWTALMKISLSSRFGRETSLD